MARERLRLLSYMVGGFPLSLFERIADVLDCDLDFDEARSGPAPGQDPFGEGSADLGWICSTSYVDLATRAVDPSVRIAGVAWVPDDEDVADQPVYFGDLVTRADSGVGSLADLEGSKIACNDEVSLSGHVAIKLALHDQGYDPESFAALEFTGGHRNSLTELVTGRVDAAIVDSVVLSEAARHDDKIAGLHRIERVGPFPTQPLVASTRLAPEFVAELGQALLDSNDDPAMNAELQAASLQRFAVVDDDHYEPIRSALARLS